MKEKTIKDPWCVYGGISLDIGKVVKDGKNSVHILYSEGQMYSAECWDTAYVKRFSKLEDAVDYYIENRPAVDIRCREFTDKEVRNLVRYRFPSYFEKK